MLTAFVPLMLLPLPLALLACGVAALRAPGAARLAMLILAGLGAALAAFFLLGGAVGGVVQLPLGPPGTGLSLGLDPLSGFCLLPVLLGGAAAALFGLGRGEGRGAALPVLLAGLVLVLLAADGFALLLGLGLAAFAGWGLASPAEHAAEGRPALPGQLGAFVVAAVCLAAIFGLLAPAPGGVPDLRFVAMHAGVPGGWRAIAVLVLALLAATALIGLWPLQAWLPDAAGNAEGAGAALLGGTGPVLGLYVVTRVLLDLGGTLPPGWWGWPLIVLGAFAAVLAMLRANLEAELHSLVALAGIGHAGLALIGLGLALVARAADLPPLAALATGAVLLHGFALALYQPGLLMAASSIGTGAGTRRLDRLGGLFRSMPVTTIVVAVGAFGLAALPAGAGFAGIWLLAQALLAALRLGGVGGQLLLALAMGALGLAVGLAASAMVRLIGIAFLGRPRSPRGAAAEEAPRPARIAAGFLVGCAALLGLFPGPVLGLAGPALHALLGIDETRRDDALLLVPLAGLPAYSAVAVAGLLLLVVLLIAWAGGRWARAGHRIAPAWDSGFAAPPAWLPFGDPATELGPAGFSGELQRIFRPVLPGARPASPALRSVADRIAAALARPPAAGEIGVPLALAVLAAMLLAIWLAGA